MYDIITTKEAMEYIERLEELYSLHEDIETTLSKKDAWMFKNLADYLKLQFCSVTDRINESVTFKGKEKENV